MPPRNVNKPRRLNLPDMHNITHVAIDGDSRIHDFFDELGIQGHCNVWLLPIKDAMAANILFQDWLKLRGIEPYGLKGTFL